MIKMIKGTYGRKVGRNVEAMTSASPAFSLPEAREAELVAAGVAVKVETPAQPVKKTAAEPEAPTAKGKAKTGSKTGAAR